VLCCLPSGEPMARQVIAAGADVLVSGSFLLQHPGGVAQGVRELLGT